MNDPLIVRRLEGFGNLPRNHQRFINWEGALRDPLSEGGPLDELEDQRHCAVRFLEAVNAADIGMIQRGKRSRLALEPRGTFLVSNEQTRQDLDRDVAIELGIAGAIHLTHSTGANLGGDFVWAKAGTWFD